MLRRRKPTYIKRNAAQRADYLTRQSDDEVRVLSLDLTTRGLYCPLVKEELQRRGLDGLNPDDHDLPHEAFGQDDTIRRLPNTLEYAWKWLNFHAVKCLLPLILLFVGVALIDPEAHVLIGWLILLCFLCTLPFLFGWFNFRFNPLRYTLVRPFNAQRYSKPLQRFITRNIGLRCQGVGLACKELKTSWLLVAFGRFQYVAAFVHLGVLVFMAILCGMFYPWLRPSLRFCRKAKNPSDYQYIAKQFQHNRLLIFKHFFTGGQCLNLQSEDDSWRYAIQVLIHHSDFIIVDLSSVKPSSEWEIEYLMRSKRIADCIPVCQQGFEQAASAYSNLFVWPILVYNKYGKVLNSELPVTALIREITEPDLSTLPLPPVAATGQPSSEDKLSTLVGPQE